MGFRDWMRRRRERRNFSLAFFLFVQLPQAFEDETGRVERDAAGIVGLGWNGVEGEFAVGPGECEIESFLAGEIAAKRVRERAFVEAQARVFSDMIQDQRAGFAAVAERLHEIGERDERKFAGDA